MAELIVSFAPFVTASSELLRLKAPLLASDTRRTGASRCKHADRTARCMVLPLGSERRELWMLAQA